jgi:transcription elongation factor Elf1
VSTQADSETVEQLEKWKQTRYIDLHRKLLGLKIKDSYLPVLDKHIRRVAKGFAQSNFVLQFEDVFPDQALFCELFSEANGIVSEQFPDSRAENPQPSLMKKAANAWYRYSSMNDIAQKIGISWEALSLCLRSAFHPILVRYSEQLSPLVKQDSWRQKACPVCGGKPDFSFLDREAGTRWLICSRCDTEWLFLRLECPFCGNRDQDSLAYLTDGKELYRLYTCERCRTYIKAINLRCTEGEVLFPLERILTLDLDRQAHEAGYQPGW